MTSYSISQEEYNYIIDLLLLDLAGTRDFNKREYKKKLIKKVRFKIYGLCHKGDTKK